jgi:hypothetical protein
MSELDDLIKRIEKGITNNRSYIKTIRHPKLLVASLKELREMIGNDNVKEAIATDISHLIMSKMRSEQYPEMVEDEIMLNIVLKGEPGVGKTVLATKIGKIFYSLGYLKGGKKENSGVGSTLKGMFGGSNNSTTDNTGLILYIMFIFIILLVTFISVAWSFYERFGGEWTIAMLIIIVLLIIFVGYLIAASINDSNNTNSTNNVNNANNTNNVNNTNNTNNTNSTNNDNANNISNTPGIQDDVFPPDDQIIKIAKKDDFCGEYLGQTTPKTNKLLNECRGKVLFVDEAYELVSARNDIYGNEAATALNVFMSEHPNEIIVIFAGYKNKLENSVFAAQPGLKRRFMYHFTCEGYTPEQLFKIFKLQLRKKGWGVTNEEEMLKMFISEKSAFPYSGGDTEKLTHYVKGEYDKEYMTNGEKMRMGIISPHHVKKGIAKLKANDYGHNINTNDNDNDHMTNVLTQMMKKTR